MATVRGIEVDAQSRCAHYRAACDIVAIRMACCEEYYACRSCHDALADHPAALWPIRQRNQSAVRCGACGSELDIATYLACEDRCPRCAAAFNPGCRKHQHLYFES